MKQAWLWAVALLAAGCSAEARNEAPTDESTDQKIIGGVDDPNDPAVVAVYARVPGATKGALCTGEIISPTVVLTAAHCITEVDPGSVHHVIPGFKFKEVPESQWLAVKETHADPQFDAQNLPNGHDIGVLILQEPTTIAPLPFVRTPLPDSVVGQSVRLVGYGLNDGFGQTGAGIKREVTVPINSMDDKTLETGTFSKKSCNGDSGGPAFLKIDGKETIVGVTSYGIIYCLGYGYYTRVDKYTAFIDQYLQ
ncbi:trypsin-like serine protease [Pendulispora brunnea]|uniref:Trypsin-like serine protease n=1 Tax=Pendulispora brunnea TaxID=2905690 RepID=A0ABZ2K170_9BACT